jgi:hypothetical protein
VTFVEFVRKYGAREPQRPPVNNDELRLLSEADGVRELSPPPIAVEEQKVPEMKGDPGCHLWVFTSSARCPFINEHAVVTPPLESGCVKHTNLTGGAPACCGGELWFDPADETLVYVNGCSGRYGPQSAAELEDAVSAIFSLGYKAASFGWDAQANRPAMVLRR